MQHEHNWRQRARPLRTQPRTREASSTSKVHAARAWELTCDAQSAAGRADLAQQRLLATRRARSGGHGERIRIAEPAGRTRHARGSGILADGRSGHSCTQTNKQDEEQPIGVRHRSRRSSPPPLRASGALWKSELRSGWTCWTRLAGSLAEQRLEGSQWARDGAETDDRVAVESDRTRRTVGILALKHSFKRSQRTQLTHTVNEIRAPG